MGNWEEVASAPPPLSGHFLDLSVQVSSAGIVVGAHIAACALSKRPWIASGGIHAPPVR